MPAVLYVDGQKVSPAEGLSISDMPPRCSIDQFGTLTVSFPRKVIAAGQMFILESEPATADAFVPDWLPDGSERW